MSPKPPCRNWIDPGWAQALAPVEPMVTQMGQFLRDEVAAGRKYLPAGAKRALVHLSVRQTRVLIVGQDPYPTPGHAVGPVFSVAPERFHRIRRRCRTSAPEYRQDPDIRCRPTVTDAVGNGVPTPEQGAHGAAREPGSPRRKGARVTRDAPSKPWSRGRPSRWGRDPVGT